MIELFIELFIELRPSRENSCVEPFSPEEAESSEHLIMLVIELFIGPLRADY